MLQPGTVIGGYRIDGLIGRGAMGEVYRAMQLSLKRPVAVKRIAAHLLQEPQAVARFEREAQCVARVQSQHVVAVHDFARHADANGEQHWLLVMELVDGGSSLGRVLSERGGRLDWRSATSIAMQVAEGLAAAGEFAVVHRDIKPDNILVNRKGVAKLTDFGLAKASDSSAMTASGAVLGTPMYMPPEACRGAEVDARGDLYSLGCTWYHCLAGEPPFRAASTIALLRAHCEDAPPDVRLRAPETPMAVAELVSRLLAKRADQRPESARELVGLIEALAARGMAIPRTVPEVLGADSQQATAITQVAAQDATAATAIAGADGTAATRLAAATAATVVPATPVTKRRRGLWMIAGAAAIALITGAVIASSMNQRDPARLVHEALQAGDTGLALQRAEALLAQHPNAAFAVEAVRTAITGESELLCRAGRHADAVARLDEHRKRFSWFDPGPHRLRVGIDEARWLMANERDSEALDRFAELRQTWPDDLALCDIIVTTLAERHPQSHVAVAAAYRLADRGTGALSAPAIAILTQYLQNDGPYGDSAEQVRAVLLRRHPAIVDTVRPWLSASGYEQRCNAALLLASANALSDAEAIRHHLRNAVELSASYNAASESVAWLAAEVAKPDWDRRREAADLPPFTTIQGLDTWNDLATALIDLLARGFREQIIAPAVTWTTSDDEHLRWNAMRILDACGARDRIDLPAFHATTLTLFNPLYESAPYVAALTWCKERSGTADAARARAMLQAGCAHITTEAATYERAEMGSRAAECRKRLQQVESVLSALVVP